MKYTYEFPESLSILRTCKRGMNLESVTYEGVKGRTAETFRCIADGGFDFIRFPINFIYFLDENGNLDEEKMPVVDQAIRNSLDAGLPFILDLHYWDDLLTKVDGETLSLFLSMWRQIALRYRDYPEALFYEFYNEPHGDILTAEVWNGIQLQVYREIRAIDPDRILFFSPAWYNKSERLDVLSFPQDDPRIVIDVHIYHPEAFTHQKVLNCFPDRIPYTQEIFDAFCRSMTLALEYRQKTGAPIIVGEFSVSPYSPENEISAFLSDITAFMEENDMPWMYWDYDHYWAVYDNGTQAWKEFRYGALMGKYKKFMK